MDTGHRGVPTDEDMKDWIKRRSDGFAADFAATRDVSAKVGDEALRFLGLAHLGGIAGCLGFVGALKQASTMIGGALAVFIAGVVALLAAHLIRYRMLMLTAVFIKDQSREFADRPTVQTAHKLDKEARARGRTYIDRSLYAALVSAGLFVLGSALAASAALQVKGPASPQQAAHDSAPHNGHVAASAPAAGDRAAGAASAPRLGTARTVPGTPQ